MKLIINADDLGFSPIVNHTIFALHNMGRLSSTSMVVNMPASQMAFDGFKEHPNLNVGIHLNLTKGKPITPGPQIPSLIRARGSFYSAPFFYPQAVTGAISQRDVKIECRAQIELALDAGLHPTHLDSHNHWHMLPSFNKIILKLAGEYKIPIARPTNLRSSLLSSQIWLVAAVDRKIPSRNQIQLIMYWHWTTG